jgi:hypothetical protein
MDQQTQLMPPPKERSATKGATEKGLGACRQMTHLETNHCRGGRAGRWRYMAVFRAMGWALTAFALCTQNPEAQIAPGELRSRADYLANAAERCQRRIDSGELDECTVIVKWENNREISIQEAQAYAARLRKSACIFDAGVALKDDRRSCAGRVQHIFARAGSGLSSAALSCVAGCLGNGLTVRGCLSSCGVGAVYPTQVLEEAVQETNSCLEQSLSADKRRRQECQR